MPGLATVAAALNANDPCLARIAAVHLRIPDLPDRAARDDMEAADILIKWRAKADAREIHKASPDDPKHPGWPAGTAGGRRRKISSKDGDAEISQDIKERIRRTEARRALRTGLRAILRLGCRSSGEFDPEP